MSYVSTDPIADMLSRIRNAIAVRQTEISLPHSKVKESIAQLLSENNFIEGVEVADSNGRKVLNLHLIDANRNTNITEIVRLSTPGRRLYVRADQIPVVKRGRGLVIVSTSRGLMTGEHAKSSRIGGELICRVY